MTGPGPVLVRGGGVAGLACAVTLAEQGVLATLAEAGPRIGSAASWKAGGMLAPWCERESAEALVVELGQEALDWWPAHHDAVVRRGSLVLATRRDGAELDLVVGHARPLELMIVSTRTGLPPQSAALVGARPALARPQYSPDSTITLSKLRL